MLCVMCAVIEPAWLRNGVEKRLRASTLLSTRWIYGWTAKHPDTKSSWVQSKYLMDKSSALPASSLIMPRTYLQSALHVQRSSKTSLNAAGCEIFEQCLPWRPSLIYFCNTQCCWNQNTIQSTTLCSNQWENAVGIVLALGGSGNSACHFSQESQPSRHSGNRFHLPGWETNF